MILAFLPCAASQGFAYLTLVIRLLSVLIEPELFAHCLPGERNLFVLSNRRRGVARVAQESKCWEPVLSEALPHYLPERILRTQLVHRENARPEAIQRVKAVICSKHRGQ